jgi:SulP family sulfate permease
MFAAYRTASLWEVAIGALTLAVLILLPRRTRRVPAALVALPVAAIAALLVNHSSSAHVATIASRFHHGGRSRGGGIPRLPPLPLLPWLPAAPTDSRSCSASTSSASSSPERSPWPCSAAIESLLSAVVADGMAQTKHDPDAELLALGIGNVLTPFFGGIPATGAIAAHRHQHPLRGTLARRSIIHALTVLAAVVVLAPLIGYLPMASLAALLLLVAWNMSEVKHFGTSCAWRRRATWRCSSPATASRCSSTW